MTALNVLTADVSAPAPVSRIELTELFDAGRAGNGGVVWVFRDQDDFWCVRLEGSRTETFATRDEAVAFARTLGEIAGPYRLLLQAVDGRFRQEFVDPDCGCEQQGGNVCDCR